MGTSFQISSPIWNILKGKAALMIDTTQALRGFSIEKALHGIGEYTQEPGEGYTVEAYFVLSGKMKSS